MESGRANWEAPRCDSQKTRSSWWQRVCVHMAGRPQFPALFGGVRAEGEEAGLPAGSGGGLPCSDKMGFSVLCELALRWQLWELMILCAKNQGGEVIWSFSFFLVSPCSKKNVGGVRGRVGEEKGFICFGCGGDGPPSLRCVQRCRAAAACPAGDLDPDLVRLPSPSERKFRLHFSSCAWWTSSARWCLVIKLYFESGLSYPVL